jgi:predicted ester cyclase
MSNVEILKRMLETIWNLGDADAIPEFYHPEYTAHYEGDFELTYAQLKGALKIQRTAFPDFHEECHDLISEGDQVVARLTLTGTHLGDYLGQSPTGKTFEIGSLDIYRFDEGKIIEQWGISDSAKMAKQLGLEG